MHRIDLPPTTDSQLLQIARRRKLDTNELIKSYIHEGIQSSSASPLWAAIQYVGKCLLTALLVILGLRFFPVTLSQQLPPIPFPLADLVRWFGTFLVTFSPWPITILVALWILAASESAFSVLLGLFGALRKIKLFGAEFELNEYTKRKIQNAAAEIDTAVNEYKKRVDRKVSRLVSRHQIDQRIAALVDSRSMQSFVPNRQHFRCTIHIPDPIEDGRLYQLLNYYPTGGGHGRAFSTRYGIIGKVWRTDQDQIENNLLKENDDKELAAEDVHNIIVQIMLEWGMTRREAENAIKHRSYFCFLLIHEQTKVGLVYMDCVKAKSFTAEHKDAVIKTANEELAAAISALLDDLSSVSLQIDLEAD